MPVLMQPSIRIKDVAHSRMRFKHVRIHQLFYAYGRWWQKRTTRTALRADEESRDFDYFRDNQMVRVFDESKPMARPVQGLTYDEFINESAL